MLLKGTKSCACSHSLVIPGSGQQISPAQHLPSDCRTIGTSSALTGMAAGERHGTCIPPACSDSHTHIASSSLTSFLFSSTHRNTGCHKPGHLLHSAVPRSIHMNNQVMAATSPTGDQDAGGPGEASASAAGSGGISSSCNKDAAAGSSEGTARNSLVIEAEKLKDDANQYFKQQDYQEAVNLYTKAIQLSPMSAVYHANRSIANLRMENFGYALNDANTCLQLDPNYVKGYYRRAAAHMALGRFKQALKDFETVVKVRPGDQDAKRKVHECAKIVKQVAFAKAIAVDDSIVRKSVAEGINLETMLVESNYPGPRIDDKQGITPGFMTDMMDWFRSGKRLHKRYAFQIILSAGSILQNNPSLVDIPVPPESKFTVCGDIHGQYYDLLNVFHMNGVPSPDNPYLFNGDFVDRGSFSLECILTLFGFKILLPDHFFLARGNHESMTMNQMYGFEGEVKSKYSSTMYDLFAEVFNHLPLAHCINHKVLVMHGGLFSSDEVTLEDIRNTDRNRQPPDEGIMCELLWSDPMPAPGRAPSKRGVGSEYLLLISLTESRSHWIDAFCFRQFFFSVQFGPDVTQRFLTKNHLDYVIRSHEVKADGYELAHEGKCITVFSAPNYCDTMGNRGSFITMNGTDLKPNFTTYSEVPHPDVKPMAYASSLFNFM